MCHTNPIHAFSALSIFMIILVASSCMDKMEVLPDDHLKLIKIERVIDGIKSSKFFNYDQKGRMVEFIDSSYTINHQRITYKDDRAVLIEFYSGQPLVKIREHELVYGQFGRLILVNHYRITSGSERRLSSKTRYEYDDLGRLVTTRDKSLAHDDGSLCKYFWRNDNLIHMLEYRHGELFYEERFIYDRKKSHHHFLPFHLTSPLYWSKNNVIESHLIDHTDLIDKSCFHCFYPMEYNEFGYPIKIDYSWGSTDKLFYE